MDTTTKQRRLWFGLAISALSLVGGLTIALRFFALRERLSLGLMAWPAAGFLLGLALAFLPAALRAMQLDDELEALPALLADDLEAFSARRFDRTLQYVVLTVAAAFFEVWLIIRYQKWLAHWGNTSVLVVALAVALLVAAFGLRSGWFQARRYRFPYWVYALPAMGFLACALLGMSYAEPAGWPQMSRVERRELASSETAYRLTLRGSDLGMNLGAIDFEGGGEFSCDDDGCALLLLAIVLIVIVVIAVGASATIPHFWVVGTMALLTIMALVTIRELLYQPAGAPGLEHV